jgi:hypothetical protein
MSGDLTPVRTFLSREFEAAATGIVVSLAPRVERLSDRIFNLPLGLLLSGPGPD